jgi:hypothetical protein
VARAKLVEEPATVRRDASFCCLSKEVHIGADRWLLEVFANNILAARSMGLIASGPGRLTVLPDERAVGMLFDKSIDVAAL